MGPLVPAPRTPLPAPTGQPVQGQVVERSTPPKPAGWKPPDGWPPLDEIQYVKEAISTVLLVLALPWLLYKLVTNPGHLVRGLGRKHTT